MSSTWESGNVIRFMDEALPGEFMYSGLSARQLYSLACKRPISIIVRAAIAVGVRDDEVHDRLNRVEITARTKPPSP